METFDTFKANKTLNETLSKELEKLFAAGEAAKKSDVRSGIKVIDDTLGTCILEADEEKYNYINLLQEKIRFGDTPSNELYDIPGFKINGTTMNLVIPKAKMEEFADIAEVIQDKLSSLGVKFPSQVYQFRRVNKGKNLPGRDFPPPEPKTMEMTYDQYEEYLENYYKSHGVKKEPDEAAFRRPYPHEKIDFSRNGKGIDESYQNEYFQQEFAKKAAGRGTTTVAPTGARMRVTAKSLKRPSIFNTKDRPDSVDVNQKWQKIESFVLKAAAVAAGVFVAAKLIGYNPGLLVLGAGAASFALVCYIKKRMKRAKNKEKYMAEIEEERRKRAEEKAKAEAKAKEKEKEKEHEGEAPVVTPPTGPDHTTTPPTRTTAPAGTGKTPKKKPTKKPAPTGTTGTTGTPGGTGGTTTPPTTTTSSPVDLSGVDLVTAETELGADQAEYARLNAEIGVIVAQVQELLRSSNPEDKEALRVLQDQLAVLNQERMQVIYNLMNRQEKLFDDMGISFSR